VYLVTSQLLRRGRNDAARTYRFGLARGFASLGLHARIVDSAGLVCHVRAGAVGPSDIVVAAAPELLAFPRSLRRAMRRTNLLAYVSQWFPRQRAFCRRHGLPDLGTGPLTARAVVDCRPAAIYTSNTESCFEFFGSWIDAFGALHSFPLAYDRMFYEASLRAPKPELDAKVVYVGGYWPYKGRNLRRFLLPFEEHLAVYGYSSWPFGDYRGVLDADDEANVHRSAAVVPGINEPHAELMGGDVCERVFKVAGVGGLCVADLCFGYRDLFSDEELLMPASDAEYVEIVESILSGSLDTKPYREAGRRAVRERHLYEHRAAAMLQAVGLAAPGTAQPAVEIDAAAEA
jgi:hypothetical protein